MGIAARSSVRIEASLPPYRPNGVRMASQMYAVSMVTLRISSRRAADGRGQASPIERIALRSQVGHLLLLFDMYGLQQCEIERCFRRQRDIAIAGESRTAGTRRRTDHRTDGSSSRSTTAHHDRRALAFSFAGSHCGRSLNFIILPVDSDAREREAQRGAAFEPAGRFCVIHDSLGASTLRDGDLSFDFNGRFNGR